MAAMSASGSDGPSPAPKLSSAPGPPSRSARARNRDSAAPIFPSSVPTIRYAGLIAPELFVFELLLALTQASVFVFPAASVAWAIASTGRLDAPSAAARTAVAVPAAAVLLRRRGRRARGRARRRRGIGCRGRLGRRGSKAADADADPGQDDRSDGRDHDQSATATRERECDRQQGRDRADSAGQIAERHRQHLLYRRPVEALAARVLKRILHRDVAAERRAGDVGRGDDHDRAAEEQDEEEDHGQRARSAAAPLGGSGRVFHVRAAYPLPTRQPPRATSIVTSPLSSVRSVGTPCSARVASVCGAGWP